MKNTENKEEWVNKVLESARHMQKQTPSDDLYEKVLDEIDRQKEHISLAWVRAIAAIFLCVLALEVVISIQNTGDTIELTEIIPDNDNTLYYE